MVIAEAVEVERVTHGDTVELQEPVTEHLGEGLCFRSRQRERKIMRESAK